MKEKFEQEQKDNHNHIEDLTMDMPDMEDDEKFRQWLEETYINEAELIEKSLLAGQEYEKNLDIAEELSVPREKFYQRLKEEGLYEDEAIEEIQDKIGVKVPEFYYRPVGMEFYDYIIDESVALAKIEYEYNGLIIALYIDQQNEEVASDVYAMQGDEQETIVTGDEKTEVTIKRVEDENEEIPNYVASWTKGDVAYTLTGRMNIEEFEKIIKYMKF